ncbi:MAG TPA: 1,4-alpha-glucan branching protein domain-containing protein [Thermoleophilaceae bacterium]
MSEREGALALVLHSHMPYVEGFGTWPFGEEWLWEAVACVYLPLLELLDGAPLTVGLTPVLCDQLEAMRGEPGERFLAYLREVKASIHAEDAAGLEQGGEPALADEVRRAARDYVDAEAAFERCGRDLLGRFAALERVELWTSAATHAVLPLLATDAGLNLQLATGVHAHARRFGAWSGGFWLPECAYVPGLERQLVDHGVRAFCVDQTRALGLGAPEQLLPVVTGAGPIAVPIDWATVELVWDDRAGYPVNDGYRDYHRRTIHDLRPWNNGGEAYDHEAALALAREHARDFVARAKARLASGGLLCCALDTELLGHWWYEGTAWLAGVLTEADEQGLELVTVSEGLERTPAVERELTASTWGAGKDMSTWDAPGVAELATGARAAELRTVAAASRPLALDGASRSAAAAGAVLSSPDNGSAAPEGFAASASSAHDALARAARELLALQSSDWAFMLTRDLAADYPHERVRAHGADLDAALRALKDCAAAPEPALRELAPDLDIASLTTP